MGMAASQGRFLALTSRNIDIGRELGSLSLQKTALTRDMRKVSQEYNEALSAKSLKWSNNGGATYVDLTYSNLMTPSDMNQYNSYLVTDLNDKVVIDGNYKKYAEMISPEGKAGAKWGGDTRLQILSELTGISEEDIAKQGEYLEECCQKEEILTKIELREPTSAKIAKTNNLELFKLSGLTDGKEYKPDDIKNGLLKLASYTGDYSEKFKTAVNEVMLLYKSEKITFNMETFAGQLLGAYQSAGGYTQKIDETNYATSLNASSHIVYWDPSEFSTFKSQHEAWENEYKPAYNEYQAASNKYDALFTKDQERKIKFYDNLFSTIAEQGWTFNSQVSDKNYLNEMFQNNLYTITVTNRETTYDSESKKCSSFNTYDTTLASNFSNIIEVNDNDIRDKALSDYQYKKSIINEKENRIDIRMDNLKTEQSAIKQMLEGIQAVMNNNIEKTFNLYG